VKIPLIEYRAALSAPRRS